MNAELAIVEGIDLGFDTNLVADALEARFITDVNNIPATHKFSKGEYRRTVFMGKGELIIGHRHKTAHWNIMHKGRASVVMKGTRKEIQAPAVFWSEDNVRKILFIHEDCVFETIHRTEETDIEKLEDELVVKTEVWKSRFGNYIEWTFKDKLIGHNESNATQV